MSRAVTPIRFTEAKGILHQIPEFQQVWSVRMTTANVVVSEENIPFIKLVFPAVRNRQWDGNAMNTLPEDEYVLTNTGTSYQLETGTIPGDYLRVVQEDSGDAYNDNKQEEVYVRNIGLIYRERKVPNIVQRKVSAILPSA